MESNDEDIYNDENYVNLRDLLRGLPGQASPSTNEVQTQTGFGDGLVNSNSNSDSRRPFPVSLSASTSLSAFEDIPNPLEPLYSDFLNITRGYANGMLSRQLHRAQQSHSLDSLLDPSNLARDPMSPIWRDVIPNEVWTEDSSFAWLHDVIEPRPPVASPQPLSTIAAFLILFLLILDRINPPNTCV